LPMDCRIVVLLAMHRSGSSALAGHLHHAGLALPSEPLPPHPLDNPDGHFEPKELVAINNRALKHLGLDWQSTRAIIQADLEAPVLDETRRDIEAYLAKACAQNRLLILKDPRLSRLLPLWWPAIQAQCDKPLIIHLVREPNATAASLARRAQHPKLAGAAITDTALGTSLWLRYNLDAYRHRALADPGNSYSLSYEDFSQKASGRRALHRWLNRKLAPHKLHKNHQRLAITPARPEPRPDWPKDWDWQRLLQQSYRLLCDPENHNLKELFTQHPVTHSQEAQWLAQLDSSFSHPIPGPHQPGAPLPKALKARASIKHTSGALATAPKPLTPGERLWCCIPLVRKPTRPEFLFISEAPHTRGHIYRVKNPVDALSRAGHRAAWLTPRAALAAKHWVKDAKALVVHRCTWSDDLARLYQLARRHGTKTWYDLDDWVFEPSFVDTGEIAFIGALSPQAREQWRQKLTGYRRALLAADAGLAATPELRRGMAMAGIDTDLKPNGLSPETLALGKHWAEERAKGRLNSPSLKRLGYASGTATHQADFETIKAPLLDFLKDNPDWQFTAIGALDVSALEQALPAGQVERRPLVEHINLGYELARLDLNLAPLEMNNRFCAAKSPLKWFEAAACQVPTLASDTGALQHWITPEEDGLLADSKDAWQQTLLNISAEEDQRQAIGQKAENRVKTELTESWLATELLQTLQRSL